MNNDRNKKIEEILGSLDGSKKATMTAFFYTRLKARMEKGIESDTKKSWLLRPVFAITVLAAVLLINGLVIFSNETSKETAANDADTLQSIAAEYSLNDVSSVYDLNQDK
jgi:hypothetical protein